MTQHTELRGPNGHENWVAALRGSLALDAFELQLYSDAHITDEVLDGAGPYTFHNAIPARVIGTFTHVATLRVEMYLGSSTADLSRTDTSRYHGGWLADEISSIAGLLLGIRLRTGAVSRTFESGDPRGRPRADTDAPASPIPHLHRGWIIPRANGTHNIRLELLPLFATYPRLTAVQAIALVRAARLYQDAMWVAESEPELAWLFFVSAVEVVATEHMVTTQQPEEILLLSFPKLHAALERAGGDSLISECASYLSRLLRATSRFLEFIQEFLPPEPPRPTENVDVILWNCQTLRKALSKVYDYRSRALHDGTPFPWPMSDPPMRRGFYHERPPGLAAGTDEAAWVSDDLPMLLHVFEHITRGAIIRWWSSIVGATPHSSGPESLETSQEPSAPG